MTSAPEIPKRLEPTKETVRHLFAHSGNECAFEGCQRKLINHRDQLVGQVCHIRGALTGSERFNAAMTNEERRDRKNLLLLCYDHHVETNEVAEFPVERLEEIKRAHENRFAASPLPVSARVLESAVEALAASAITDTSDRVVLRLPQTLQALCDQQGWGVGPEELAESLTGLPELLAPLRMLPIDTRRIFALFLQRGSAFGDGHLGLQLFELDRSLHPRLEDGELDGHLDVLASRGVAHRVWENESPDGDRWREIEYLVTRDPDWPFWSSFQAFCQTAGLDVVEVVDGLRFDVLDAGVLAKD